MIDRFMKLKTWQKLSLGIAILTIFKILTMGMNGFIINVKAEENNSCTIPTILVGDGDTGLLKVEDFNTKGPYKTNYLTNDKLNELVNDKYIFGIKGLEINNTHENVSNILIKDKEINIGNNNIDTSIINSGYSNYYDSVSLTLNPSSDIENGITLNSNTEYSILFFMGNDGNNYGRTNILNDVNINLSLTYKNNDSIYTSDNYTWYEIENYYYDTPGLSYTCEYASYIMVKFKTNDLIGNFTSQDNTYYLKNIEITLNNASYGMYDTIDLASYKYFYKSTSNNAILNVTNIYLVMDGDLITGDYDYAGLNGNPLSKTQCATCSSILDIECQINKILCYIESFIKNIIYSLKILLTNIFVPNWQEIQEKITLLKVGITSKIPDIQGFWDYMEYCVERFNNVERQTTISFSGVKLPGYNDSWVIPPFTYDFNNVINEPTINTYYGIVRAVVTVLILLGYCIFCINIISSIIHSTQIEVGGNNK